MVRRILLLSALLLFAGVMRTGLWMIIHHPEWSTTQGELAQMYRNMAHQSEGYAIACRAIIKTGKPDNIPGVGLVSDPVLAQTLANQYETQAASYRAQAHVQESLNQGYSIR